MGAIAPLVGLQAQYQVTRLLKLKEFRADVRQYMLNSLLRSILDKATSYTNLERLKTLEEKVETALEEQIIAAIQEVENESAQAKNRPLSSLFAQRLCRQLKT
jgi:predicted RNase H-like nuclease